MNDRLQELYKSVILAHHKNPVGFGPLAEHVQVVEATNTMCGDTFRVGVSIQGDALTDLGFEGHGCAISRASASVLVKHLSGQNLKAARGICEEFLKVVDPECQNNPATSDDFEAFAATREFPGRHTCAALVWEKMLEYLITTAE